MTETEQDATIKVCCATFYESDIVRMLLGDVLHPGGLELTGHLGEMIGLGVSDSVLDIACGRGTSAVYLAKTYGCHVTGLDFSAENIAVSESCAATSGVSHSTSFQEGDAEILPFENGTFDAVISECSFCTFPNKGVAATEIARVLHPGGRLGLSDMTINGVLPDEIQSLLSWVVCIAGAGTAEDYITELQGAGFTEFAVEDHRQALLDMVRDIRRKLLGVELAVGFSKLKLDNFDIGEAKQLARCAVELIDSGGIGYNIIAGRMPDR